MINYTYLLIGVIYTTILPGFVIVEFFLRKLQFWLKLPLYLLLSTVISTNFSYVTALIFGFNRTTLVCDFVFFLCLLIFGIVRKKISIVTDLKKDWPVVLFGLFVYIVFFISLFPAIFSKFNGYFVMSGPNWQDTAMHLSIIESLSQGNFPPLAPYFSGAPLTYYYFSDLHAAILNTFYGQFFPRVLVLFNSYFAMLFFFSVFALSYKLTKSKIVSIITGLMSVFSGNLGFINLFKELLPSFKNYTQLLTNNPFSSNSEILQMVPMADYFLQNRPMMVGLPCVVLIVLLLIEEEYLWAGILTALLLKFQLFGFVVGCIFFTSFVLIRLLTKKIKFKEAFSKLIYLVFPTLIYATLFLSTKVENRSLIKLFLDSFSWGPWEIHNFDWYLKFILLNFNIGFLVFIFSFFFKKTWKNIEFIPVYLTSIIIFTIPFVCTFTIYKFDMFKFFYYLIPFICISLAVFYNSFKNKKLSIFIFLLILFMSSLTSVNLLIHSYLNKNQGYSMSDYNTGIWIRENTPQKSVFVTMPTVHSAPSDIGGRLRVISYINWPYSHGFNVGADNVFTRVKDVEAVYGTGEVDLVSVKYEAKYIFYGEEERSSYPNAEIKFQKNKHLQKVFDDGESIVYKII